VSPAGPTLTFVSRNPGKAREVREVLAPYGVRVRWRRRELPEPQADSLREVVRAKLRAVEGWPGDVLVEDSGLFVPSLGGFPGIYSAHFLKLWGFPPLLELLRRRPRAAYFETVAGLRHDGRLHLFSGRVDGAIAQRPRGSGGFGYDPVFVPRGSRRTFAELTLAEKNATSHRARAVRKVGEYLRGSRGRG
jgi:XTP/dITP diphosphohydrolase